MSFHATHWTLAGRRTLTFERWVFDVRFRGGVVLLCVALGAAGPVWAQTLAPPPSDAVVSRNPYLPPPPGSGANPYAPHPYQPPGFSSGHNPYLPNPNATTINPFPGFKQNLTPTSGATADANSASSGGSDAVSGTWASPGASAATVHPREITIRGGNGELRRGSLGAVVYFDGAPYRLEGWSGNALLVRSERSRETLRLLPGDGSDGRGVYQFPSGPDRQPTFSNPLTTPIQKEGPPKSAAPAYWNQDGRGGG